MGDMKDPFSAMDGGLDLSAVQPQKASTPERDTLQQTIALAADAGFRTEVTRRRRRRPPPRVPFTMRMTEDLRSTFQQLSDKEDLTYDALLELLISNYLERH